MLFEFCLHRYYFQSYRDFYGTKSELFCPIEFRVFLIVTCQIEKMRIYLVLIELSEKSHKQHDPHVIPDVD